MVLLHRSIIFSFISGLVCGLAFAPVFFIPGIFMISVLCRQIQSANNGLQALKYGYFFGFGYFLSSLYWIAFALLVYIEQFWWAFPFALFGLPLFMSIFIALVAVISWRFRDYSYYHMVFCLMWIFFEWLSSWIFTGLPWSLIGYSLAFSDLLLQSASIFGIFGLSFFVVYIGSSFYAYKQRALSKPHFWHSKITTSLILIISMVAFGYIRLSDNPTKFSEVKVRLVQPSVEQKAKWDPEIFWENLDRHIELSRQQGDPDLIIWSEAAITAPYHYKPIMAALKMAFTKKGQILISGGVSSAEEGETNAPIYSSLIALDGNGVALFDYHKSHLVPFGEYMPLKNILPLKKITHGFEDYTQGIRQTVYLPSLNLTIQPMICYEAIFPFEVIISNKQADLIINISNDSWYGNSSGPYQHFHISRIRAIENGLPMIRVANNGISAVIDPLGRVVGSLKLQQVGILDEKIPLKVNFETIFSEIGYLSIMVAISVVALIQFLSDKVIAFLTRKNKNLLQS